MNVAPQLAHDEPLSPEIVLVLPPELRAEALARLGPPVWPTPRRAHAPRRPAVPPAVDVAVDEPLARAVGGILATRVAQLALIFVMVTITVLAMSLVAQAMRADPVQIRPVDQAAHPGPSGRSESRVPSYRTRYGSPPDSAAPPLERRSARAPRRAGERMRRG